MSYQLQSRPTEARWNRMFREAFGEYPDWQPIDTFASEAEAMEAKQNEEGNATNGEYMYRIVEV